MRSIDVDARDLRACEEILRHGSKSFRAASLLLPSRVRMPATVVYAFCRIADDAIDQAPAVERAEALGRLRGRLGEIFDGRPAASAVDRALSAVVQQRNLPRAPFDLLLEGFEWDVERRRYETLQELLGYCVRVASTVGVLMAVLMGERRASALHRAADLGVAMQLTNIARDVGEDARDGRIYLPLSWMRQAGIEPDAWLREPRPSPRLAALVARLLEHAAEHYRRADEGIAVLPRACRPAIRLARLTYADIGRDLRRAGYDSVTRRAHTSARRKIWLAARASRTLLRATAPDVSFVPLDAARDLVQAITSKD